MREKDLHDALVARLLPEYEESLKRLIEAQSRHTPLSDDEWWDLVVKPMAAKDPAWATKLEARKEEMIRGRHAMKAAHQAVPPTVLAKHRADELLPFLLKVRRVRRAKGPITDNQYHAASLVASLAQIATMRRKIKEAAKDATDPRRKRILEMLGSHIFADLKSLRTLVRKDVSEERVEDVANEIASRFQAMTNSLQQ